jgi:hypothetical protein
MHPGTHPPRASFDGNVRARPSSRVQGEAPPPRTERRPLVTNVHQGPSFVAMAATGSTIPHTSRTPLRGNTSSPGVTASNRPRTPLKTYTRQLDLQTNNAVATVIKNNNLGQDTNDALQTALQGDSLSDAQVAVLKAKLKDPNVLPQDKAVIASVLQNDAELKLKQQAASAAGSVTPGSGSPDSGGSSPDSPVTPDYAPVGPSPGYVPAPPVESAGSDDSDAGQEQATEYGMKITELLDGTARDQGMKEGDVILSVNGVDTPTYEALRSVLRRAGSEAEVIFINTDNGRTESITLYPDHGRIGIACVSTPVQ